MPHKYHWTKEQLRYVETNTANGTSYDVMAEHLGISRNAVLEIARKYPAAREARARLREEATAAGTKYRDQSTLPAGHPISWRAITAGTCLAGSPYDGIPMNQSQARPYMRDPNVGES